MIVVTGATGQLGRGVVEGLLDRGQAGEIIASVRDATKATDLAARGVEVRVGDFSDPASLEAAFRGASQVLVISADKLGDEALRLHRNAIDAARNAGVCRRILYTSHMGARAGSPFLAADQHAGTEADLAASGVAYTALRHGFYAESCLYMIGDGLRSGELRVPEDGPISWTARADLAAADAAILMNEGAWDGVTPPLTASEAVTMAEIASIASEVTGREVRHVTVTDEAWRNGKIADGMPAIYAEMLLGTFRAARRGDFSTTDATLERLLGRAPHTMRDVLTVTLCERNDQH
ncbi:Quinone oxidoreductase 2 [Brevundimonas sp. NIBR10]|uniref:SDR family oxidoreductase n=1 Tax=Brevundimonas sp. NIBR10 TaxID=3015997 RepID=UPI0022F1C83A|nr:SDR family oxidoreductase [Brevundimonas sp. NIBR10]WGM45968.1 Quinone oxidoreductase 2 [Brevundimonas sp. NIBR10]